MLEDIQRRLTHLEESISGIGYQIQNAMTTDSKRRVRNQPGLDAQYGMQLALVVSTEDPLKAGRIKIYHPVADQETPPPEVSKLQWACPISSLGGLDDSGSFWVPPAGSKVAIIYLNGNYNDPYYLGTIWDRHRGPYGQHTDYWYNYPYMDEFNTLYEGKRGGYNFVANDGDQVMPPCNTDSYNGYDWDDTENFNLHPDDDRTTFTNYHVLKTTGKHALKFIDGNHKCNKKGRRVELLTGRGIGLIMKDDHLHDFSDFVYGQDFSTLDRCGAECEKPEPTGGNPFHKRREEVRLYTGSATPGHQKIDLPQSGAQLQSLSGQGFIMDDSVDQPSGVPDWDLDFNTGCNDTLKCFTKVRSGTGHSIKLRDIEDVPNVRSDENGIYATTALGNFFDMSDHTEEGGDCRAGTKRGFTMMSTSTHMFMMNDEGLKRCGSPRMYSPINGPADQSGFEGFVMLRSGYGLQLLMKDMDIQTETKNQFIQLMAPQRDNEERGPHLLVMQEQPSGPGFVILRAGGVLFKSSYDESLEVVGDEDENPSSKFVAVTEHYLTDVKGVYFNHANMHVLYSESVIFLLAGKDCPVPDEADAANSTQASNSGIAAAEANPGSADGSSAQEELAPCVYQAITSKDPWACPLTGYVHFGVGNGGDSRSERVFVSAKN